MKYSVRLSGHRDPANCPLSGSIRSVTIPLRRPLERSSIIRILYRSLHKLSPDRQCGFRSLKIQFAVVIESHPDDTNQIGGNPANSRRGRSLSYPPRRSEAPRTTPAAVPLCTTSSNRLRIRNATLRSRTGRCSGSVRKNIDPFPDRISAINAGFT